MGSFKGILINFFICLLVDILWRIYRKAVETERITNFWAWFLKFASYEQELEFYQSYKRKWMEKVIGDMIFILLIFSVGFLFIQLLLPGPGINT